MIKALRPVSLVQRAPKEFGSVSHSGSDELGTRSGPVWQNKLRRARKGKQDVDCWREGGVFQVEKTIGAWA